MKDLGRLSVLLLTLISLWGCSARIVHPEGSWYHPTVVFGEESEPFAGYAIDANCFIEYEEGVYEPIQTTLCANLDDWFVTFGGEPLKEENKDGATAEYEPDIFVKIIDFKPEVHSNWLVKYLCVLSVTLVPCLTDTISRGVIQVYDADGVLLEQEQVEFAHTEVWGIWGLALNTARQNHPIIRRKHREMGERLMTHVINLTEGASRRLDLTEEGS